MKHSNNAARIRIYLKLKGLTEHVDMKTVTYADLQTEDFKKVNPLKKVPGWVCADGMTLCESNVILDYCRDKWGEYGPNLEMDTPEERAFVNLVCRLHDLYVASPNCTQPNFAHSQGCMYLAPYPTPHCAPERCMDAQTRAAKCAELFKQLTWLEENIKGPWIAGERITIADCTWFPTTIFMEFMLPRVFDWSPIFYETEVFPKITAWFKKCMENEHFSTTRQ